MVDDPARIDAHVVGDHVTGQADAPGAGPVTQVGQGPGSAKVGGDPVVVEGVGGRDCLRVPAQTLDPLGRRRALPQPDQPQAGDAPDGERVQLFVGDAVEGPDIAFVAARELIQPDIRALGDKDQARHPVAVLAEPLFLAELVLVDLRWAAGPVIMGREPGPVGCLALLGQDVQRDQELVQQVVDGAVELARPVGPDPAQLIGQRTRRRGGRLTEKLDQRTTFRPEAGPTAEEAFERVGHGSQRLALADGAQVDQLAERVDRGVLVETGQQQELGHGRRWVGGLGHGQASRELGAEGTDRSAQRCVAQPVAQPGIGRDQGRRVGFGPVAIDQAAEDGHQQTGRVELAGGQRVVADARGVIAGGRRLARPPRVARGRPSCVDPGGDRPSRRQVRGEGQIGQPVAGPGRSSQPEVLSGGPAAGHAQPGVPDPAPTGARSAAA